MAGFDEFKLDGFVLPTAGTLQIIALNTIELLGFSTSATVWPHKKAVKKIEAEGAKEKQLLPKLGNAIGL